MPFPPVSESQVPETPNAPRRIFTAPESLSSPRLVYLHPANSQSPRGFPEVKPNTETCKQPRSRKIFRKTKMPAQAFFPFRDPFGQGFLFPVFGAKIKSLTFTRSGIPHYQRPVRRMKQGMKFGKNPPPPVACPIMVKNFLRSLSLFTCLWLNGLTTFYLKSISS